MFYCEVCEIFQSSYYVVHQKQPLEVFSKKLFLIISQYLPESTYFKEHL